MAFEIPRTPTLLESLSQGLQLGLPGLVQGAQTRTRQQALQDFALQQGLNLPPGLPPELAQNLIQKAFDPFGQQAANVGLTTARTGQVGAETAFTTGPKTRLTDAEAIAAGQVVIGIGGTLVNRTTGQTIARGLAPQPAGGGRPSGFQEQQNLIDRLSAIPKDQRTPVQQQRLDQLLGRKPPTASQKKAQIQLDAYKAAKAIPPEQRSLFQQQTVESFEAGRPLVTVDLGEKKTTNTLALRRDFQKDSRIKDMRIIEKFTANVETAYQRSLTTKINLGPIDITLAKSFQKLTDLGSTVREGEFATTFEGQRLINRWRGKIQSFLKGGLGFTPEDRKELRDLVLALEQDSKKLFNQAMTEFSVTADEFDFNKRAIFGGVEPFEIGGQVLPQGQQRLPQAGLTPDEQAELAELNRRAGAQ